MPVSLALCSEQVEVLSAKLELNVTWERGPGWQGSTRRGNQPLGQSCHQSSSLRDKAKCGSSHATYTFHFLLSSCPKRGRNETKKNNKKIKKKGRGGVEKKKGC